jgi:NAD-dependent DNA ligase
LWTEQGKAAFAATDNNKYIDKKEQSPSKIQGAWLRENTFDFGIIPVLPASSKLKIAITGKFGYGREELTTMIEDAGHSVAKSLDQETILLAGINPGFKIEKAQESNTRVVCFGELLYLFSTGHLPQ